MQLAPIIPIQSPEPCPKWLLRLLFLGIVSTGLVACGPATENPRQANPLVTCSFINDTLAPNYHRDHLSYETVTRNFDWNLVSIHLVKNEYTDHTDTVREIAVNKSQLTYYFGSDKHFLSEAAFRDESFVVDQQLHVGISNATVFELLHQPVRSCDWIKIGNEETTSEIALHIEGEKVTEMLVSLYHE